MRHITIKSRLPRRRGTGQLLADIGADQSLRSIPPRVITTV